MCTGVLVLGELGLVLHTHCVVAVGESGVETALRGVRLLTQSILGLCPGWWAAILNIYTVLEKWAFESLVPQPEPSPTLHAWGVRSGASWLQRKVSGCWVLDIPGGGTHGLKRHWLTAVWGGGLLVRTAVSSRW